MALENCCKACGDGTFPGHDLCAGCAKKRELALTPLTPGDNWRASIRPTRPFRSAVPSRSRAVRRSVR